MANVPITYGSGQASIAGDTVGAVTYQQIKIADGTAGGTTGLIVNADGTLNARISGSVLSAGSTFNGSVSGTVGASVIGHAPVFIVGGSIAGTFTTANQSVSGTVGASIIGTVPVVQSGTVITSIAGTANVSGSVAAWINSSNSSVIGVQQGSVAVAIISGSIAATFTPPANQSVSGTVQTDVRGSVAVAIISGSIAATFSPPANQSVSGTVGASVIGHAPVVIVGGSIAASFTPPANQSVSGTVNIGTGGPVSVLGTMSVIGTVPVTQSTNPWTVVSSLAGGIFPISGSVAAVVTNTVPVTAVGSVIATNIGSVITVFQAPSIVGSYAEDAAFAQNDKGLFVLGVRNDNMSSVTSADLDYSQMAVGPIGENIVANAPITKWVQGTADFRNGNAGASIIAIPSGGSSVFTYITGVQVANMGSASVLVTLASGGSILGYTIAPAGGGSNIIYRNALKTPGNFGFAASLSGIASVLLSAQGFTART